MRHGAECAVFAVAQDRHCIFTFLQDYMRNPTYAEPYFAVTMFDDLLERKGVVLVRGDFSGHLTKAVSTDPLCLLALGPGLRFH